MRATSRVVVRKKRTHYLGHVYLDHELVGTCQWDHSDDKRHRYMLFYPTGSDEPVAYASVTDMRLKLPHDYKPTA